MLVSVFFYTYIIHLLIDALHDMLTKPFNFYVERISTFFFDGSVHFLICSKRENKMGRFCLLIHAPPFYLFIKTVHRLENIELSFPTNDTCIEAFIKIRNLVRN